MHGLSATRGWWIIPRQIRSKRVYMGAYAPRGSMDDKKHTHLMNSVAEVAAHLELIERMLK